MYVCICNAVTEKQVREAACGGAKTLQDLQCDLGVATGCGQCAQDANNLLTQSKAGETGPRAAVVSASG